MRFGVLGPLAVWTSEGHPVEIPERKVRVLLAHLVVHEGRPISADQLIDDLWGDRRPSDPPAALRTKVSQLRRALETAEPGGRALVVHRKPGYALQIGDDAIDAASFTRLVAQAQRTTDLRSRIALLSDALDLWRGPVLADLADTAFTQPASTRWSEQRLAALEDLAEARLDLGEHRDLTAVLPELIREHPLRERLRSVYMRALYRAGRQGDALRTYTDLRTRLVEELGVDPSPELAALHIAILEQDPALDAPPPLSGHRRLRTNLPPASLTTLVGRDEAVREVHSLLDSNRLVTLTGPGGVGKTRLALEVASQRVDTVPDGVWLVELAGLADADADASAMATARNVTTEADVACAVTSALGVREQTVATLSGVVHDDDARSGEDTVIDRLLEAVADRTRLIVLDNCEHVIAPATMLAERLLRAAPGLHVLATSREPLKITGETLWTVPPLDLPSDDAAADPLAVDQSAAVQLFVARVTSAAPGFALDATTAPSVATICRRLDGIPLALELAATRVRALGVGELAARLDDRFHILGRGSRTAAARHQTLEAMIDWSWQRLTAAQQTILRRLAVSADGYDLDAAEQICAGDDVKASDVVDILTDLVDRSLVVVDVEHPRYSLLESVAAYCVNRLAEADELLAVRERHDRYFTDLAEHANAGLRGPAQGQWLRRLDIESNNLRQALDGAIQRSDSTLALRLVNAMAWYWFLRGRYSDGHRSLTRAIAADGGPAAARAEAAALQAGFSRWADRGARSSETLAEVLALFDGVDEPAGRARAQWFLALTDFGVNKAAAGDALVDATLTTFTELEDDWGMAASLVLRADRAYVLRGELTEARLDAERAVALFRAIGDRWGEMQGLEVLEPLAEIAGDYERAHRLASEMLHIAEDLDTPAAVSYALSRLGRIALLTGDHASADDFHRRAREVAAQQSDWIAQEFAEVGLALGARREGRLDDAETYLTRWTDRLRDQENNVVLAFFMTELGFVAELRGDAELALARQLEASAAAHTTGEPRAIALSLEGLAGALRLQGHAHEAARCLGAAGAARTSVGAPLPTAERGDVDRITSHLRTSLSPDRLQAELEQGAACDHAMLLDDIRATVASGPLRHLVAG